MSATGCGYPLAIQGPFDGKQGSAAGYHLENPAHDGHRLGVDLVALAVFGEPEAVDGLAVGYDLPLPRLAHLAAPAPLSDLQAFVSGYLVQDAVRELSLRTFVAPVVESPDLCPVFRELLPQQV